MNFQKYIYPILLSKDSYKFSSRFRIFLIISAMIIITIFISIETLFDYSVSRLCGEEYGLDLQICYLKRAPLVQPEKSLEDHLVNIEYELSYSLYQDRVENILIDVPTKFGIFETHVMRSVKNQQIEYLSSTEIFDLNSVCSANSECNQTNIDKSTSNHIQSFAHMENTDTNISTTTTTTTDNIHTNKNYKNVNEPKTLILIHGYGTTSIFAWRHIFDELVLHYDQVIALDLPGFGRTKMSEDVFDVSVDYDTTNELYCEWLINTQKLLNLTTPPYIVGHSFGGYITTQCVSRFPSLASRVLIADVPGMLSANGGYSYLWFQFFRYSLPYSIVRSLGKYYSNKVMDFASYIFNHHQPPLHHDYWLHLQLSPTLRAGELLSKLLHIDGFTAIGKGMALAPLLNITRPLTIVFGDKDFVSPVSHGEFLSEVGGYRLIVIKNGSHCPYQHKDRDYFIQVCFYKYFMNSYIFMYLYVYLMYLLS